MRSLRKVAVLSALVLSLFAVPAAFPHADPGQAAQSENHSRLHIRMKAKASRSTGAIVSDPSGAATDQFFGFQRYPAETQFWTLMDSANPIAYYRDVFVGGETVSIAGNNGDQIYAQLWNAKTNTFAGSWFPITYYVTYNYNGQTLQSCWVTGFGPPLCNAVDIDVLWYSDQQCEDGLWTMKFFRNQKEFAEGTFKELPQVPPGTGLTNYNQGQYNVAGDEYADQCYWANQMNGSQYHHSCDPTHLQPNELPFYISNKGCFLSSVANLLEYHAVPATPPDLNNFFLNPQNFSDIKNPAERSGYRGLNVWSPAANRYAQKYNSRLTFLRNASSDTTADPKICLYGPQLMGVKCKPRKLSNGTTVLKPQHWVTVYGQNEAKNDWLLYDPNGGKNTTLSFAYPNGYCAVRVFAGPEQQFTTQQGITITFHSPVELLLTDPQGRRLGLDPIANLYYSEIPGGSYDSAGLADDVTGAEDLDPDKQIYVPAEVEGEYSLTVTGTSDGKYAADFDFLDVNGQDTGTGLRDVPISTNQVQKFSFNFKSAAGATTTLSGGYAGGGQRPRDVNQFLTYGNPTADRVTLSAGTRSFPLLIFYAPAVVADSFTAVLNGIDVKQLFHPQPGGFEVVNVPLNSGRNVLVLSILGNLPSRVAEDTDRFEFTVP